MLDVLAHPGPTLGHELRNPLSPLLTSLELLKLASREEPTVGRVVGVMQRQASHLVRLVPINQALHLRIEILDADGYAREPQLAQHD